MVIPLVLERYVRYWTVLPPANLAPDLVRYGSYTSGITMHVYNDYPPGLAEQWGMAGVIPMRDQKRTETPGQVYSKMGAIDKHCCPKQRKFSKPMLIPIRLQA
jgi:hypothetical protein